MDDAIIEMINEFKKGKLKDDPTCFTVEWMKNLKLN